MEYLDVDAQGKSIFGVVGQFNIHDEYSRRPDLLIFVNGIPLAIFEMTSAIRGDKTIHEA